MKSIIRENNGDLTFFRNRLYFFFFNAEQLQVSLQVRDWFQSAIGTPPTQTDFEHIKFEISGQERGVPGYKTGQAGQMFPKIRRHRSCSRRF